MARGHGSEEAPVEKREQQPAGAAFHEEDDEDFEIDEAYFLRTYRPLSNLPTPPPSSRNSMSTQSPKSLLEDGESLESKYLGPAIHLANLIPSSASLMTPSVPLVHAILSRADLPLDTIALAVCILDSLDRKFALTWRLACPLDGAPAAAAAGGGGGGRVTAASGSGGIGGSYVGPGPHHQTPPPPSTFMSMSPTSSPVGGSHYNVHSRSRSTNFAYQPVSLRRQQQQQQQQAPHDPYAVSGSQPRRHIDSVPPELIIVSALVIALKFVDDMQDPSTAYYEWHWGRGLWTSAQINATERCIMSCLGYRIMPLWDRELIRDARWDMDRAAREREVEDQLLEAGQRFEADDDDDDAAYAVANALGLSGHHQYRAHRHQELTPEYTPTDEKDKGQLEMRVEEVVLTE